jgi:hypothetical protein
VPRTLEPSGVPRAESPEPEGEPDVVTAVGLVAVVVGVVADTCVSMREQADVPVGEDAV